jgi:TetR/AcrR family transcriptional regulator, transcriptional repressor for nem operon
MGWQATRLPHRQDCLLGETVARPKEFDEECALGAAIECFWRRGYEATSVRDLAAAMGISGPSLYNAFGDKRALFLKALQSYLDQSARAMIKRLEESLPPKEAVRRFLEEIIEHSVRDRERRGCFLINSALEVAPHDSELSEFIATRFGEIEAFFHRSIKAAQAEGTIPRDRPRGILRGCCSAFCSEFAFSHARNPTARCSKASRGQLLHYSIDADKPGTTNSTMRQYPIANKFAEHVIESPALPGRCRNS